MLNSLDIIGLFPTICMNFSNFKVELNSITCMQTHFKVVFCSLYGTLLSTIPLH